jgi:hypothetical protein
MSVTSLAGAMGYQDWMMFAADLCGNRFSFGKRRSRHDREAGPLSCRAD